MNTVLGGWGKPYAEIAPFQTCILSFEGPGQRSSCRLPLEWPGRPVTTNGIPEKTLAKFQSITDESAGRKILRPIARRLAGCLKEPPSWVVVLERTHPLGTK